MATTDPASRERLARLVRQRRISLGWHKAKAAEAAELTITTYMRVENGATVRDVTYAKIEKALGWAPGACQAVLEGAEEAQEAGEIVAGVRIAEVADSREGVRKAVHNAIVATMPEVPTGTMAKFSDAVFQELQRQGIVPPEDEG
ncbi:hypothetical protein AMK26_10560 [Streptomyces sp. CB03234]|uniref:helix-turn-helix domain-containing protein n=1 Tax=Streptomyces sp. (strain CB03234) TaxID=1703937 RepID=UPI00093A7BCA|nr:helix-turn-helix domain-containing protein [Streptomyces sp. CB03234]OKK06450.1 hypothetical protein AMK26_10560 [Streptomyces sp. CB03234]